MAIIKVNGWTVGEIRADEVDAKALEKAGFTVIIK